MNYSNSSLLEIYLKVPSPYSALLLGVLFVVSVILLVPAQLLYTGSFYSWLYIEMSLFFLFIGLLIGTKKIYFKTLRVPFFINLNSLKRWFSFGLFMGIVGVLFRIYDKIFIRGASLTQNIMENRTVLAEHGVNFFSILSSFLYPIVLFLPFYYLLLRRFHAASRMQLLFTLFLTLFPVIDGIMFGSRSIIMIWLLLNLMYLYSLGYISFRLNIFKTFIVIMALFTFFSLNGFFFDLRTSLIGIDPVASTQESIYAYFLPLNDTAIYTLDTLKDTFLYYFYLGIINFLQYMAHGFFELLYLVDNFNPDNAYLGQQNFAVVAKFFAKVFQIPFSFENNQALLVRTGIYNTLFGPIYYDFAFFGIFFSLLLGIIIGKIVGSILLYRKYILVPLYLYMMLLLYFSLVVNLITFAQGVYNLVSFTIFYLFGSVIIKLKRAGKV